MSDREDDRIPDLFETGIFQTGKFTGIYCSTDCVLDSFDRGYPEHRGVVPDENE